MSATSVMVSSSSSTAATFAVAWSMMARAWLFRPEVLWSVMAMLLWLFVRRHQFVSLSLDPPTLMVGWVGRDARMPLRTGRIGLIKGPQFHQPEGHLVDATFSHSPGQVSS